MGEELTLFNIDEFDICKKEWQDMPEYNNINMPKPEITATFKFRSKDDFEIFKELIGKHLYNNERVFDGMQRETIKSAWYPPHNKASGYIYK